MDLIAPKRKRGCRLSQPKPLPLIPTASGEFQKFYGTFDGFSVTINNVEQMKSVVSMGYFGKATLSRSFPQFEGTWDKPAIIRDRQYRIRKKWNEKYKDKELRKVVVVPDSGDEEYFTNLQARYEIDKCGYKEVVNLMLEEAFFLHDALECLNVFYNKQLLDSGKLWDYLSESCPSFGLKYAVYYHFRCKNWIVKPGIKFGGDYLLYKEGPPFHHASYVVLIRNESDEIQTTTLMGLQRMCETSGKELLICQISMPDGITLPTDLHKVGIKEILMKRWISSQERQES